MLQELCEWELHQQQPLALNSEYRFDLVEGGSGLISFDRGFSDFAK